MGGLSDTGHSVGLAVDLSLVNRNGREAFSGRSFGSFPVAVRLVLGTLLLTLSV